MGLNELVVSYDSFIDIYQPIKNQFTESAFDNYMFETYGAELLFVQNQDKDNIWSIIENENKLFILNGMHVVNLLGYMITKLPHVHETVEVVID